MGKVSAAILGSIIGGLGAVAAIIFWFGWGMPGKGQTAHIDPARSDYVDLLLTVTTIFLGAVGLAVTVGALVIGLVALKTLREIKEEASNEAKDVAEAKINEKMATELESNVNEKMQEILPEALDKVLRHNGLVDRILSEMAQRGTLDEVLERVATRMQGGGPEPDPDNADQSAND